MEDGKLITFRDILEFKASLERDLAELKKTSEQYSKAIGDKLRVEDSANTPELADLREKIEPTDPKKKKPVKRKDSKDKWYDIGGVSVYDGVGLRAELEIYFKTLEDVKSRIEKMQKIKDAIDGLVSRGVKRDLGCTAYLSRDLILSMAFTKSAAPKTKFTYKSIFNVGVEHLNEIKN